MTEKPTASGWSWPRAWPIEYGWVNVIVASLAMTATLPGRTHGLGLVTEPLLADLRLDHVWFARINLASALLGALFAIPVGWLIDRFGVRVVLSFVTLALGLSVLGMSQSQTGLSLAATMYLVRGLGQSALSVASMAVISKWFNRRLGIAMGVFAVLLTFGFIGSVLAVGAAVESVGWRAAWWNIGIALLALTPVFWIFARNAAESPSSKADGIAAAMPAQEESARSLSMVEALRSPVFWMVALGTSAFNLVWSGVTLFNESMLVERGLDREIAVEIMAILTGVGLIANLVCGSLAARHRILRLLGGSLFILATSLAIFPSIQSPAMAKIYAGLIGLSGGAITVVFFAAWRHLFGKGSVGAIQGVAQFTTVVASAIGPVLMAESRAWTGSYTFAFYTLSCAVGLLGVVSLFIRPTPMASPQ